MRNPNIGLVMLLISAIIYGSTLIAAAVYSQVLRDTGWDGRYGIFGTALREIGTLPLWMAGLLAVAGVYLVVNSLIKREDIFK
ncbi:phosphatase [Virgibacillus flavescens]|uniref:phosphatase n=1 Tax=Virgibacillus flavescens TaxID=1611422 RepID=UPI003D32F833